MIYLDYNATAPLRPEVFAAMKPFLTERWGNPSSSYTFGSKLKAEIEAARRSVALLVNASTGEVIFTGSATESDNTALNAALGDTLAVLTLPESSFEALHRDEVLSVRSLAPNAA